MPNKNRPLAELSIEKLFRSGNYIVPIYQRNYAWGESEINQLIDDIYDYAKINKDKNEQDKQTYYYIGTLVVYEKGNVYEVIDGQQRLTTLYILMSVLKNKFGKTIDGVRFSLKFESREKSQKALKEIFESNISSKDDLNISIMNGYEIIEKRLNKLEYEKNLDSFFNYLKEKVQILRVEVPKDTDLNHYFEIMNNRGEQLEKHEILKSRMLYVLRGDKASTELFNSIWEACANMDKYVQYGFTTYEGTKEKKIVSLRTKIFGENWNEFLIKDFACLLSQHSVDTQRESNPTTKNNECDNPTIQNLITCYPKISSLETKQNDIDTPERFYSIINFPNFLLHVLKIQESTKSGFNEKTVPLDDKRLLETFEGKYQTPSDVKDFAYNLLKTKFLFDNYIIKREYTSKGDEWSLKQLIINDNKESKNNTAYYKNRFFKEPVGTEEAKKEEAKNKKALMLISMFHVSAPTLIYKHWLNAGLKFLFAQTQPISSTQYIEYLEDIAKAYMIDRYLSSDPQDYHEIIYINQGKRINNTIELGSLDKGTDVENFIFNYIDYLLWKDSKIDIKYKTNFSFAFRSSVEHYYPQNPEGALSQLGNNVDNFGNLCLVTNSENSRLNNRTPQAKKDLFVIDKDKKNYSIKQQIMMEYEKWSNDEINTHQKDIIEMLTLDLNYNAINIQEQNT